MIALSRAAADSIAVEIKSLYAFVERHAASQVSDEQSVLKLKISLSMVIFPASSFPVDAEFVIPVGPSEGYLELLVIMKAFRCCCCCCCC